MAAAGAGAGEIEFREVSVDYPTGRALGWIDLRIPGRRDGGHRGTYGLRQEHAGAIDSPAAGPHRGRGAGWTESICASFRPAALRRQIGFVPQETFLFSATLAENIAFGSREAQPRKRFEGGRTGRSGRRTSSTFPEGYQTLVGERGITLSGGQKQRTAIARAILRNPQSPDPR